jgi:hypothetical protein
VGLQRIPEEHEQIDLAFGDAGADLLVAAERAAAEAGDREPELLCTSRPVVAVANSSCPASRLRLYSAHSSMSCFLLSCAISAIRRPAGAGRPVAMKILSVVSRRARAA